MPHSNQAESFPTHHQGDVEFKYPYGQSALQRDKTPLVRMIPWGELMRQVAVPNRAVLSVAGPEPNLSTFLNGLLSTHVVSPPTSDLRKGFYSLFLSPQGRIFYDVFLHPHPHESTGYLLEYDPRIPNAMSLEGETASSFPTLPKLLKRYILRSKTRVADVSDQYRVYARWNDDFMAGTALEPEEWRWSNSGSVEPVWRNPIIYEQLQELASKGITRSWDLRAPRMGQRLLVPKDVSLRLPEASEDDYTLHRIINGVPEGAVDMAGGLPMERNADMMGGGQVLCGQELTVRTYHTGLIRKRVVPVRLNPKARDGPSISPPPSGLGIVPASPASLSSSPSSRPRSRGKGTLLSTIRTPSSEQHSMGLALIRLEHLEAVEKGQTTLKTQDSSNDDVGVWAVLPQRPDWWPVREQQ
ncbi:uncharacterized protein EI90DRAFT_3143576 [Cantharellus anzutake]|uniref:uncharacterized protein n=1 Tax=Cantharellus anzutake TaxID=1750568 RepID=UPI001908BDCD|nr:uncharacterized protein EI90DRAFT_3143576 [Cantharellus anzutake]KAF8342017.1 hypothetical protein EI90DRAFT_3143576 [Cantharellus anzutake]